jgi:hypothetical protein
MTATARLPTLASLRALPHLSVSQLKVFVQCPRKYSLQYVERVTPQFRPIAFAFGTAWHEAVGQLLLTSTRGADSPLDDVKAVFRERLVASVENETVPVLFDDDDDLGKTVDVGVKMIDAFTRKVPLPEKVVGVELPFSLEIRDPDFGDVLGVPIIGALDALVVDGGKATVWELKTAKKKWSSDQLEFDLQMTTYGMAAAQMGYADPELVLLVTTKTAKPDVQVERLVRHKTDRDDLAVTAQSVVTAIAAGIDHPVRGWACRTCPYAHACR